MEVSNSHHQVMAAHQLEQVLAGLNCPKHLDPQQHQQQQQQKQHQGQQQEKKVRPPNPEQALKCPRCDSSNTKFCYYNNYSLSQPRYFCKGCRRYWTQGGSLRNVPVGGGCRKNKRSSSSSSSSSASKNKPQPLATTANNSSNPVLFPPLSYDPSDLSLAFTSNLDNNAPFLNPNPNPNPSAAGFLDILRGGGGFQNGYANNASSYYFDDQACANVLPPFEGANNLDGTTSAAAATAAVEGSWINHGINVDVDSTRGYWNGGVGSYWHGLINSSLM